MVTIKPFLLDGNLQMPASKSAFQRALLLAACADGPTTLRNISWAKDTEACHLAIKQLGALTEERENTLSIDPLINWSEQLRLNLGESGLAFRMFAGFLACKKGEFELNGEGSLKSRPLKPIIESLASLKVKAQADFPLQFSSTSLPSTITIDGSFSSQFITGVIFGLCTTSGTHELIIENPTSIPYLELSLKMAEQFGAEIKSLAPFHYQIQGKEQLNAQDISIEGDWSAASNFIATAVHRGGIRLSGLDPNSLQADKAIINLLEQASATFVLNENYLQIEEQSLPSFDFNAENCPDLFPALVLLAAGIKGKSRIVGTNRLIHKESNRKESLLTNFSKQGLRIQEEENAFIIHGTGSLNAAILDSWNDHRLAMIAAVSASLSQAPIQITNAEAVNKSYPNFFEDLKKVSHSANPQY